MFGNDDVESIVSIHGGLNFLPEKPLPVMPKLLVLSGGDDDASTDIMDLEMTLDNATALWEITRYSNIQHAFSVFEDGKYNLSRMRKLRMCCSQSFARCCRTLQPLGGYALVGFCV